MTLEFVKYITFDESKLIDQIHKHFGYKSLDEILKYFGTLEGCNWLEDTIKSIANTDSDLSEDSMFEIMEYLENNI